MPVKYEKQWTYRSEPSIFIQFDALILEFCLDLYFTSRVKEKTGVCGVGTDGSGAAKVLFLGYSSEL
jgi:hypothetical protein